MRRTLLATVAASLILASCGSGDDSAGGLADVTVSKDESPKVTVAKNFSTAETESYVVNEGSGDELAEGDVVKVNYVAINGTSGKQFDNSFEADTPAVITMTEGSVIPGFIKGLSGHPVGSRVLVSIPPKDGFGTDGRSELGVESDDTMVFLFDIISTVPETAEGKAIDAPASLPTLQFDDDKHPSGFKKTSKTAANPTKMSADVVIQGSGDKIKAGQTLNVQYVGQVYPDGEVFDESWSRGAASFQIGSGGLIKCWDEQLIGQKVGSRLILVCPAKTAYGDTPPDGGAIKAGDTLVFAIDLLDAF